MTPSPDAMTTPSEILRNRNGMQRIAMLSLAVATVVTLSAVASADGAKSAETTRDTYRKAATLIKENRLEEAEKALREVWSESKSYDVAASLGELERRLEKYAEAARYLSFAIANLPPYESEKKLVALKGWFDDCRGRVASYVVTANVEGATVSVDGVEIARTPLDGPLYVEPGQHEIAVSKAGFKPASKSVAASAGSAEEIPLELAPEVSAVQRPPNTEVLAPRVVVQPVASAPHDSVVSKPNPWILVAGGAVTVGGLVTGLVFNAKANGAFSDAEQVTDLQGNYYCTGLSSTGAYCQDLRDNVKTGDRYRNYSTVGFAVAGVAAIGTVTYWLWPRKKAEALTGRVRVEAGVSKQSSHVAMSASF